MDDKSTTKDGKNEPKNLPEVEGSKEAMLEQKPQKEKYEVSHAPTPHVVKVQKSPFKIIFLTLLIFGLGGATGYFGYMYYQEKDNANNLQQQLDSSGSQPVTQTDDSSNQQEASDTISYTAEVGKFTLTLPNKYVIIKNIDGDFEGGPVTDLEIARAATETGIVNNSYSPNKVMSILKQDSTLATQIENRNQEYANKTELSSVTVDGVEVKVYRLSGLFDINRLYFEKNDNFYEIESLAPESATELSVDLNAIIDGFKFN